MHRHGSIRVVCETYGRQVLGIAPADRCLAVPKMFFAYGLGNSRLFPLSVGASTVLEPGPVHTGHRDGEPARVLAPTLFFGVADLLRRDARTRRAGRRARVACAWRPRPASRCRPRSTSASCSGSGWTSSTGSARPRRCTSSCPTGPGRCAPARAARRARLRARGSSTSRRATCRPGTEGHLLVRGDSIAPGYWCRNDATRRVFQGEWLRTGDTYVASPDGYYTYLGRSDDMIKSSGMWVSPAEVEARLLEHPEVALAAVVAVPDAVGLDKTVACVVRTPDATVAAGRTGRVLPGRARALQVPAYACCSSPSCP